MNYRVGSVYRIKSKYKGQEKSYDALCIESRPNPLDPENQVIGLINLSTMKRSDYLIGVNSTHFESKNQSIVMDILQEDESKSIPDVRNQIIDSKSIYLKSVTYYKNRIEYNEDLVEIDFENPQIGTKFRYVLKPDNTQHTLILDANRLAIARVPFGVRIYYFSKL